jgi:hypothetical protein
MDEDQLICRRDQSKSRVGELFMFLNPLKELGLLFYWLKLKFVLDFDSRLCYL